MLNAIETFELTKKYKDVTAVDSLSLTVREGELFSLLGVNGAGKTTTVKMLSCLTKPTSGDAVVFGKSILRDRQAVKSVIAVSPQENAVAGNLTVKENLSLVAAFHGLPKDEAEKRISSYSEKFGLSDVFGKTASKLSGGWQRRLNICMALVCDPKILFLDEPSLGLDVLARRELWDMITELKKSMTVILTTHYMEEAEALSDRLAVMKNGLLLKCGTPGEVISGTDSKNLEEAFVKIVSGK